MMNKTTLPTLAAALLLTTVGAHADGYVVGHSTVNVGPADVREVFLGNIQFAGSVKLVPVDNAAVQGDFLTKVIKMDPDRYSSVWTKKSFRDGINAPSVKSGDVEVLDFVKRTPGAIGYVSTNPGSANVILKY